MSFRVTRTGRASWQGTVADGGGRLTVGSGAFEGPYSLRTRVEHDVAATNPEELLGAAEAACFTMSLANTLSELGHPPHDLQTTARVTLEQVGEQFNITRIELVAVGEVPGIDQERFAAVAQQAKDCTVSRALTGTQITLDARLGDAGG